MKNNDGLNAARGILNGCLIALVIWGLLGFSAWAWRFFS